MTDLQRKIVMIAGVVAIGMLIYPPFQMHNGYNAGYGFILKPPIYGASVNVSLLFAQWIGVLVVIGLANLILKTGNEEDPVTKRRRMLGYESDEKIINSPSSISTNTEYNIVQRFWCGKERLWKAYWLVAVVGGYVVVVLATAIGLSPGFVGLLLIPYLIWSAVSVWRCAVNTDWVGWGAIARTMVLLGTIGFFIQLFSLK